MATSIIDEYIFQVKSFSKLKPKTILEIGALDGEYTHELREAFSISKDDTFLVEPNPELRENLLHIAKPSNIFSVAVSNIRGKLTLNRVVSTEKNKIGCSSLKRRVDSWGSNLDYLPVMVDVITGADLMKTISQQIDLCIIDVEGLAFEVLESFQELLSDINSILIECEHSAIFENQRLFSEVHTFLVNSGFQMMSFRYSYKNQSDSVWIRSEYIDMSFRK